MSDNIDQIEKEKQDKLAEQNASLARSVNISRAFKPITDNIINQFSTLKII
jgi:hypothetical protein